MKKSTLFWCTVLLCGSAYLFSQNTVSLEANGSYITNNGTGDQAWGEDIIMNAIKIGGEPGAVVYETQFTDDGFGVKGGRWDQIDYYQDYQGQRVNASEKFVLTFRSPVSDVVLQVGQMDPREGRKRAPGRDCDDSNGRTRVDESGKWTAFDENNVLIGSGILLDEFSINGKLANSKGAYRFNLDTQNQLIKRIEIEATQWGGEEFGCPTYRSSYNNESGNKENNSEFNIGAISYTKQNASENNPPVAEEDGAISGDPDFTLTLGETLAIPFETLLANDTDPDGDELTIIAVQRERGGDVAIVGETVEFTGTGAFPGALFIYTVSDGRGGTDTAGVFLNVLDLPEEPTFDAVDDAPGPVREDIGLTAFSYDVFLANDIGENLRITSFDFSGFPGTIEDQRSDRRIQFRTAVNFNGEIRIPYTITDGTDTDTAVITLTITDINDELNLGQDGPYTIDEGESLTVSVSELLSNDTASNFGGPITIELTGVGNAVNGSVSLVGDEVVFTPTAGFTGQASFTYDVDVLSGSVFGDDKRVDEGTSEPIVVNVEDDGVSPPSINQKAILVSKADEKSYLQVNAKGNRTSAIVEDCDEEGQVWTISDRGDGFHKIINDYADKALEAWRRTPGNGDDVTIYSSNNLDWQRWEILDAGDGYFHIKGKYNERYMTLENGNAVMRDQNNADNQRWKFLDPQQVDCEQEPINNPPVAGDDGDFFNDPAYTLTVGETLVLPFSQLLANDTDPDGDPLTITAVEFLRNGTPVIVGNTVEFTGESASPGALFSYTLSDGRGGEDVGFVSLNILDVEDPTINAVDDAPGPVREDIGLTAFSYDVFLANDIGENLRITSFDFSDFPGTIEDLRSDRRIQFRTAVNFNGEIRIPYTITDGTDTDTAVITLTITDIIDELNLGQDGPYTIDEGESLTVSVSELLSNDTASNFGGPITIELTGVGNAVNGSVSLVGDEVVFTPTAGFTGQASFTYDVDVLSGSVFGDDKRVDEGTSDPIVVNVEGDGGTEPLEEIVLQSNAIDPDGSTAAQLWGSCTEISASSAEGNPAAIARIRGRLGVKGDRYDSQLDYNSTLDSSERLEINFNRPVTAVSFTVGNLEVDEWEDADETGTWRLFDSNGNEVGQGIISPSTGAEAGKSVYRFEAISGTPAVRLQLEATAYDSGQGPPRTGNNSDYSLINVAFTPLQESCGGQASSIARQAPPLVYPTLVSQTMNVEVGKQAQKAKQQILAVYFYNGGGTLVKKDLLNGKTKGACDVNELNAGVYIVRVVTTTGSYGYKIVKR